MAFRRKRRFKGNWLAVAYDELGGEQQFCVVRSDQVTATKDGTVGINLTTVALDIPVDTEGLGGLLNDFQQGGYALRRIVGKCFVNVEPAVPDASVAATVLNQRPTGVIVTAGFFVARTEQTTGDTAPIGSSIGAVINNQYNPQSPLCITEPWIWRRTWLLGDPVLRANLNANIAGGQFSSDGSRPVDGNWNNPPSNTLYGSVSDGAHVDAKTRRRILSDERLFFAIAARTTPAGVDNTNNGTDQVVSYNLDLRVYGASRRKRNRSAF